MKQKQKKNNILHTYKKNTHKKSKNKKKQKGEIFHRPYELQNYSDSELNETKNDDENKIKSATHDHPDMVRTAILTQVIHSLYYIYFALCVCVCVFVYVCMGISLATNKKNL